jgi:hypothetical protein
MWQSLVFDFCMAQLPMAEIVTEFDAIEVRVYTGMLVANAGELFVV